MFNRPRCRDWSPLATQQLRLRNLIGISGQNIICNIKSQLYFTLHLTTMSAPFYTSEKVDSHGSGNVEWPEINCPMILKSTAKCVCIRIWEHIPEQQHLHHNRIPRYGRYKSESKDIQDTSQLETPLSSSAPTSPISTFTSSPSTSDKMLFIWGVYFSGLVLLTKRTEAKFHANSLIFQMHGGYFASPENLTQESMRQQLKLMYQLEKNGNVGFKFGESKGDISTNSSNLEDNSSTIHSSSYVNYNEKTTRTTSRIASKSCDIFSNNTYKTNSNINYNNSRVLTKKLTTGTTSENQFQINSPRSSRNSSPVRMISTNKTSSNHNESDHNDASRDLLGMLKIRYIDKKFLKSEIRPSYTLEKLLQLQEKQRKFKNRSEDSKEVIEKICMKSAFCLNLELISSSKGLLYRRQLQQQQRHRNSLSMGRTLNRLLNDQQGQLVKPEDLLKAQDLRRQIETARFRCRLLQQQKTRAKTLLKQLEKKLCTIHDANIEHESFLMEGYRNLGKEKEALKVERIHFSKRYEDFYKIQRALDKRRKQLCYELKEIYPIEKRTQDRYTISNVYLPNSEKLITDAKLLNSSSTSNSSSNKENTKWELVSPLSISVSLGYVAHVIQMCSIILNLPLRNPIKHEGSRSRVLDIIKDLPNLPREFPLYCRSSPPPKQFLYAVFLLNQNISQLNFQVHGIKCDLKATLANLLQLLEGNNCLQAFEEDQQRILTTSTKILSENCLSLSTSLLNELSVNETGTLVGTVTTAASVSGSSVELDVKTLLMSSSPIDVVDMKHTNQRISRSVGSYSDDHLSSSSSSSSPSITTGNRQFHNSEPILNIHQKFHITNFDEAGNL